jgi:ubiquitin-protein ligase
MSKNKLKSELQNLKQDNLINYISLQGRKWNRNENYIQGPSHSIYFLTFWTISLVALFVVYVFSEDLL